MSDDIQFVKGILPDTYDVVESKSKKGSIRCISQVGIRHNGDADDDEHWNYITKAIKKHFGFRFQEIDHNVNFCHTDFTIYLKNEDKVEYEVITGIKGADNLSRAIKNEAKKYT